MKYTDCETCMSSALLGAVLSKQPQDEFWDRERDSDGECYSMWEMPDFCRADVDEFETLAGAYNAGTYLGEAAAERYNEEVLPREFEDAKREFVEAERECDRTRTMECLDNYRMLKERMNSDECGWGANWWED